MDLVVIGVGYVGLVTGTCFAHNGHHVVCVDINEEKIKELNSGIVKMYEPGLREMVQQNLAAKRLSFTTSYEEATEKAHIYFIAVDTPMKEDGSCDLRSILQVAETIGKHMKGYTVIVNKSTVPPGAALLVRKRVQEVLDARGVSFSFDVVSNPEFLKEGSAVSDFMKPDRVIIGVDTESAEKVMRDLYRRFMLSQDRLIVLDVASSELAKYAANAMLACRISFMNWLSEFCEEIGADIGNIRKGIGSDKRIGYDFLWAGIGYGGSCFPKDLRALKMSMQSVGMDPVFIEAIEKTNERQRVRFCEKIEGYFQEKGGLYGKTIALLGLSFKPDTDDMREAPSLFVIESLIKKGASLRLFDPVAQLNAKKIVGERKEITWCSSEMEAVQGADGIALLTEWKQFRYMDFEEIIRIMQGRAFFDGRNQYIPEEMRGYGFDYIAIGK